MESPNKGTLLEVFSSNSPISEINLRDLLNSPIEIATRNVLKLFSEIIRAFINAGLEPKIKAALRESQFCSDLFFNLCSDCGRSFFQNIFFFQLILIKI